MNSGITSAIRPAIGPAIRSAFEGGGAPSLASQVAALFAASEQGLWLDPSDMSTMFQDSAGSTPVTAVGQPVGKILDKSGRGNHATQATATARPVLQQDGNGKYYLAFDGVDDSMATSTFPIVGLSGDVFIGVRHETGGAGWLDVWLTSQNAAGYWAVGHSGSGVSPTGTSCGSPVYRKNGVDLIAPTRGTIFTTHIDATVVQTTKGVVFGAESSPSGITISGYAGAYWFIKGRIYSLIVRGALSDAAQIAAAEAYVAGKTGVTL